MLTPDPAGNTGPAAPAHPCQRALVRLALQGVTLSECAAGNRDQAWELQADNKLRAVGANMCLGLELGALTGELLS